MYHSFYAFGNKKQNFVFVLLFYKLGFTRQFVSTLTLHSLALTFHSFALTLNKLGCTRE